MARKRHTGAFIAGSLIGGVAGAVITLWKTPKSGEAVRSSAAGPAQADAASGSQFSNPILSFVEKATAPIVGVELGKLARDDPQAATAPPVRSSAADAQPPTAYTARTAAATGTVDEPPAGVEPVSGEPVQVPGGQPAVNPEEEATHQEDAGSAAHAATTDELTRPTPEYVEQLQEEQEGSAPGDGNVDFPDPPPEASRRG